MGQGGFGVQLLLDSNTFGCRSGLVMPRGDSYQLQGQQGGEVLGNSESSTGPFRWIQVIQDTTFATVEGNLDNIDTLEATTIPAGIGIGGLFTNVSISTGLVIAYYA